MLTLLVIYCKARSVVFISKHEVTLMNERIEDNYISLEDAAEYLNVKPVTLRKWIKQKENLPAHQIGRLWKFKRSELDEWVNSGKSAQ